MSVNFAVFVFPVNFRFGVSWRCCIWRANEEGQSRTLYKTQQYTRKTGFKPARVSSDERRLPRHDGHGKTKKEMSPNLRRAIKSKN